MAVLTILQNKISEENTRDCKNKVAINYLIALFLRSLSLHSLVAVYFNDVRYLARDIICNEQSSAK